MVAYDTENHSIISNKDILTKFRRVTARQEFCPPFEDDQKEALAKFILKVNGL